MHGSSNLFASEESCKTKRHDPELRNGVERAEMFLCVEQTVKLKNTIRASAPSGNFEILKIQIALLPCACRISPDKEKRTLELAYCSLKLKDKMGESFLVLGSEADCNREIGGKLKI